MKLAFLGLGVMGYPMAGHLARKGFDVAVFNRTTEKAKNWAAEYGGLACATIAEAVTGRDLVAMCVGNDNDARAVAGAALTALAPNTILIDHTTTSARLAREIAAQAEARDISFIDAPVSGGQAGAQNGALTIMCGGNEKQFNAALPVMQAYGKAVRLMGAAGAGQLTKMVNQICIAGVIEGLAEGLHFARRAGLDPAQVYEAISKGAAQSWQMDNRWKTMAEGRFDFGFAVDWMRKDLGVALDEARTNGAHLPAAALIDQLYGEVQSLGGARWDTSSLVARLEALGAGASKAGRTS